MSMRCACASSQALQIIFMIPLTVQSKGDSCLSIMSPLNQQESSLLDDSVCPCCNLLWQGEVFTTSQPLNKVPKFVCGFAWSLWVIYALHPEKGSSRRKFTTPKLNPAK